MVFVPKEGKADMSSLSGKLALVVDDEPDMRDVICYELKSFQCNTIEASNGHEAYDLVLNNPVDLVVCDVRMAGGDGVELLKRLRERDPKKPPIILVTGYSADLTYDQAQAMGAIALISKPINFDILIAMAQEAL